MIYFFCDCCGKKFGIDEGLVGRKGLCPDCGTMFVVPAESQSAPFRARPSQEVAAPAPPPSAPPRSIPVPTATAPRSGGTRVLGAEALALAEGGTPPAAPSRRPPAPVAPAPTPAAPAERVPSASAPSSMRTPSTVGTTRPPGARPPGKPPTRQTAAVQAAQPRASEGATARVPEPAGRGGKLGLAAACVLVAAVAAWKLGVRTPGSNGSASPSGPGPEHVVVDPRPETGGPTPTPPSPPPIDPPTPEPPRPADPPHPEPPTPKAVDPPQTEPPTPPPADPPKPEPPPAQPVDPPKPPNPDSIQPPVEEPPLDEDVAAALKQVRERLTALRGTTDDAQHARALDPLRGVLHSRDVIQFLGKLLLASPEMPAVRRRAAELLGDSGQADAVSLLERGIKASREIESVARAAIAALGRIDNPASPRKLEALVRSRLVPANDPLDNLYARDAIEALGRVKRFRNIETLMGLYLTLAQLYPGETASPTPEDERKEAHRLMLEEAVRASLASITGKAFHTYPEWAEWWQANRGHYK